MDVNEMAYRRAAARVEARFAFYRHVMIYLLVNLLLAAFNLIADRVHLWFLWAAGGWGVGLLAHGLNVYSYRWFGSHREQMIQREIERQARLRQQP